MLCVSELLVIENHSHIMIKASFDAVAFTFYDRQE